MTSENGIDEYIKNSLIFSNKLNDYISPIFSKNDKIGYGYKYNPAIDDYSNCLNY